MNHQTVYDSVEAVLLSGGELRHVNFHAFLVRLGTMHTNGAIFSYSDVLSVIYTALVDPLVVWMICVCVLIFACFKVEWR